MPKSRIEHDLENEIRRMRAEIERELDAVFAKHKTIPNDQRDRFNKLGREHDKLIERRVRLRSDRVRYEGRYL